jgi:hypothetical protein
MISTAISGAPGIGTLSIAREANAVLQEDEHVGLYAAIRA